MKAFIGIVCGGLVALASLAGAVRAEDFSIHLDQEADIDATRAAPEFKVDRVLVETGTSAAMDMPAKTYDIFLRLKEFGDVRLGQPMDLGPSAGRIVEKGRIFTGGGDAASVRVGWLKGSPEVLIVAYVEDPWPGGNDTIFYHVYTFLRLKGGRADCLMRRRQACCIRTADFEGGQPLETSRFSYDAGQGLLVETISSERHPPAKKGDPLARAGKDEDGNEVFSAEVHERITLAYKPAAADVRQVATATLVYESEDGDDLGEIARFYLGPQASRQALLDANPDLAVRYKNVKAAELIRPAAKTSIRIPVAREWFAGRCNVTMAPVPAKAAAAPVATGSAGR
jgi:hypothetical protein